MNITKFNLNNRMNKGTDCIEFSREKLNSITVKHYRNIFIITLYISEHSWD